MLVEQSALLDVVREDMDTPLHLAARHGPDELVLYLLKVCTTTASRYLLTTATAVTVYTDALYCRRMLVYR